MREKLGIASHILSGSFLLLIATSGASAATPIQILQKLDVTPEALAVCGLQDSVEAVIGGLQENATLCSVYMTKSNALVTATNNVTLLAAEADTTGDENAIAALETATNELESTRQQVETFESSLFEVITAELDAGGSERLAIWRSTRSYRVPPYFRVVELTADAWAAVELALCAERRAMWKGEPVPEETEALLTQVRTAEEVVAAANRLELHLVPLQQMFD